MRVVVAVLVLATRVAVAAPALDDGPDLGRPLASPTAEPALTGTTYLFGAGAQWIPTLPRMPQRAITLAMLSAVTHFASPGRTFWTLGIGGAFGFDAADTAVHLWSLEPLSLGLGVRRPGYVATVEAVPSIDWISQPRAARDHFYALAVDVQGCREYSASALLGRNSAVCVYVQPLIYRDGWLSGVGVGIRVAPF